jgi:hypothetical protein
MTTSVPAAPAAPAVPTAPEAGAVPTTSTEKSEGDHFVAQKDVDRILGERLGRERVKLEREFDGLKKAEREAVVAEFNAERVESKAEALAETLGFHDVKDALSVIDKSKLPLKDGKPDGDAIKALLEKLATDKPYLVKTKEEPVTKRERGKPKLPGGNPEAPEGAKKGTAAEALRALAAQRKHS